MHILRGKDGAEFVVRLYDAFRVKRPFGTSGWKMPPGNEVSFRITRDPVLIGHYQFVNGGHEIGLSDARIGHFSTLAVVLVHEMVHLVQKVAGSTTSNCEHNADFHDRALKVCRAFGFDPKEF